ncbi:transcriptional regulator [Luteimonas fraxinea]|uniref:helix-turn-helix domain-containing protein n=1 Tax=Luteimonas fraxinea TaxID=2901869 RepID=UPI001E472773
MPKKSPRAIFSARIKQARDLRGIPSQRALGVMMGLTKKRASSRVNRYENEASGVDLDGLETLAQALRVPMAYLVAEDEATADILLSLAALSAGERRKLAARLKEEFQTSATPEDVVHGPDEASG